jgi:hypothetical protein
VSARGPPAGSAARRASATPSTVRGRCSPRRPAGADAGVTGVSPKTDRSALIDTRDVGAVAAAASTRREHQIRIYTPTGPQAVSLAEVAGILSEQTGEQIRHARVPGQAVRKRRAGSLQAGLVRRRHGRLHTMLTAGYENVLTGDVRTMTGAQPARWRNSSVTSRPPSPGSRTIADRPRRQPPTTGPNNPRTPARSRSVTLAPRTSSRHERVGPVMLPTGGLARAELRRS